MPASPVAVVVLLQGNALDDGTLRQWLMATHPFFASLPSASRRVRDVVLTKPDVVVLRQLETLLYNPHCPPSHEDAASASSSSALSVRVRLLATPFLEHAFQQHVHAERQAFLSLGHAKATLPGTLLMSRAARQAAELELASGLVQSRRRGGDGAAVGQFYERFRGPSRAPLREDAVSARSIPKDGNTAALDEEGEDTMGSSSSLVVLFDDREFRSHLPYALHASGMEVVPLTLRTADYVLSPDMAVERKSIPDLLQSLLHSGRLMKQLAALSSMYSRPVCLIEGAFGEPYRLVLPSSSSLSVSKRSASSVSGVYDTFSASVYERLGKLYGKFPGLCVWWTKNALHTAAIFRRMKCSVARTNASPFNPALTMSAVALQEEEEDGIGGGGGGERSSGRVFPTRRLLSPPDGDAMTDGGSPTREENGQGGHSGSPSLPPRLTPPPPPPPPPHVKKNATMSVLAGKILHCFPGVTAANATGVMQIAGSLLGLSTIAKESLRTVMSDEEAEKLYSFLHDPLMEDVG